MKTLLRKHRPAICLGIYVLIAASCASNERSLITTTGSGKAMEAFVNGLPTLDAAMSVALRQPSISWDGYATDLEPIGSSSFDPELAQVFAQPLYDARGQEIAEYKHRNGLTPVAYSGCIGTQSIIVYSAAALERITPYSLPFVREHERAHHVRLHVRCANIDNPVPPAMPGEEQQADCDAVRALESKASGDIFIIVAADRLRNSNAAGDHIHPPDRERSRYVFNRCPVTATSMFDISGDSVVSINPYSALL